MIWFLNPFWEIYGERLKEYKIDKDFIMFLKPYYEDVNDYDFYLSLIKMKIYSSAHRICALTPSVAECQFFTPIVQYFPSSF